MYYRLYRLDDAESMKPEWFSGLENESGRRKKNLLMEDILSSAFTAIYGWQYVFHVFYSALKIKLELNFVFLFLFLINCGF